MQPNPFFGVSLHAAGGLAAGSFYLPFKGVRRWAWESYWLVGGVFSWIIAPWIAAALIVPDLGRVLASAPAASLFWSYFFGILWGVGGLTFGLSMRYLGLSLGYALALGFCAAFGTLVPPFYDQFISASGEKVTQLLTTLPGRITLGGVLLCLMGIALCGRAGMLKERQLTAKEKAETIREFAFTKGVWVAIFAGLMSACMAFAIQAGAPIAQAAEDLGTPKIWRNLPVFVVVLLGGFTTNCLWCLFLNLRNGSFRDYAAAGRAPLLLNYLLSATAGVTWYLQFFFYGMGTTQMGKYDFSSWTIHMAFIIVFSNLWGIQLREWRGVSRRTITWVWIGILVLIASTIVIGLGNHLAAKAPGA